MIICLTNNCSQSQDFRGHDIRLFTNSKVWPLAQALAKNDSIETKKLLNNDSSIVNYQEPKFGQTLLMWTVRNKQLALTKVLLAHKANPNIQNTYDQMSALIYAADDNKTSDYVNLLLHYKADTNIYANDSLALNTTPLIAAAHNRLESVEALINAGANLNFVSNRKDSALRAALRFQKADITYFLIVDKKVDISIPIGFTMINKKPIKIVDILRTWTFPLDSENYKKKMQIVEYLLRHGENYWITPIPKEYQSQYPDSYLSKY